MLAVQYLAATFVKTCKKNYRKTVKAVFAARFLTSASVPFLNKFSFVYILGNGFDSYLRIFTSHVDIAIFYCEFRGNI